MSIENNHCQSCDAIIDINDEFCGNCGSSLTISKLSEEKKQEIIELIKNQKKMRLSLVSTITGISEENIIGNARTMGLSVDDIYLVNPKLLAQRTTVEIEKSLTPLDHEVIYDKPSSIVYRPATKIGFARETGAVSIIALIFTIGALILYSIPCILINALGGISAFIAIIFGIIGAAQNKRRTMAMGCIIACVLLTVASIVARWFLWY